MHAACSCSANLLSSVSRTTFNNTASPWAMCRTMGVTCTPPAAAHCCSTQPPSQLSSPATQSPWTAAGSPHVSAGTAELPAPPDEPPGSALRARGCGRLLHRLLHLNQSRQRCFALTRHRCCCCRHHHCLPHCFQHWLCCHHHLLSLRSQGVVAAGVNSRHNSQKCTYTWLGALRLEIKAADKYICHIEVMQDG